jgi:hypothetical protein
VARREEKAKKPLAERRKQAKYFSMYEFYSLAHDMSWNGGLRVGGGPHHARHWVFNLDNQHQQHNDTLSSIETLALNLKLIWLTYGAGYHRSLECWQEFRKEWKKRGPATLDRLRIQETDWELRKSRCIKILKWIDKEVNGRQGPKPKLSRKRDLAPWDKATNDKDRKPEQDLR